MASNTRIRKSAVKIILVVAGIVVLVSVFAGMVAKSLDRSQLREKLMLVNDTHQKKVDPSLLSPVARHLFQHVNTLSGEIGERAIYQPENLEKARDYIANQFKRLGHKVQLQEFEVEGGLYVPDGRKFFNVETILEGSNKDEKPWVVGAHYDTAPKTPGADDNASGVAVLIELARFLKEVDLKRNVRLVAFATEEPPSFGSHNMGSAHYAKMLKSQNIEIKGMISLEMLGFFNDHPKSQLYPPIIGWIYPKKGNFICFVSNLSSRGIMKEAASIWRNNSELPLETLSLPHPLSMVALSDQLNFWALDYPAIMISDTAFYRNPHYHQETDTPDKLDYEKMAEITGLVVKILSR